MRKRNRSYRPRVPQGWLTIPAPFRYDSKSETNLQLVPHSELDKFRHGLADEVAWNTLAFRLNWGYVLADEFSDEARAEMIKGLDAIRSVKARHESTGKWGMTGEEFFAVGESLNLTDDMQAKTTRKEQLEAIRKTMAVNEYTKAIKSITSKGQTA